MTSASTEALYYPHIDIHDRGFLNTSALFWDRIYTIVPAEVEHPYEGSASRAFADAGILQASRVDLSSKAMEDHATRVLEYLDTEEGRALLRDDRLGSIHPGKLPWALRQFLARVLEKPHLADLKVEEYASRGRVDLPQAFVSYYMTTLAAAELERNSARPILTNEPMAGAFAADERRGARSAALRRREVAADVQAVLVQTIARTIRVHPSVDAKRIIEFRKGNEGKLNDFRQHLEGIAAGLARSKTPDEAETRIRDGNAQLSGELASIMTELEGAEIKATERALINLGLVAAGAFVNWPPLIVKGIVELIRTPFTLAAEEAQTIRRGPLGYVVLIDRSLGQPEIDLSRHLVDYR